ncbi:MAG: hypothetical protein ACUVRI_06705 [Armatimonadota bacterium]
MLFDNQKLIVLLGFALLGILASCESLAATAALLRTGLPQEKQSLVSAVFECIRAAGYQVREIGFEDLCNREMLTAVNFDLLVLPDSSLLPAGARASIDEYLKGGGDIIALNTPMWQRPLINVAGRWLTRDEYERQMAAVPPDFVVFDFASVGAAGWQRSSNDPGISTTWRVEDAGPGSGQCSLHVSIPRLTGWDTLHHEAGSKPFRKDHTLTVFSAKGGLNTTQLSIEWTETDGSRWIAVVPLTTEWRQYVLTPKDFKFWHSVPSRGFSGDTFKPENAQKLAVGLAFSHTASVGLGPHEYWIGPIGTARMKPELQEYLGAADVPKLDTLSPGYKLFECRDVASLLVRGDQVIAEKTSIPLAKVIRSVQPRPTGAGFDKGRNWRWIPVLEARSPQGEWRGVPVALIVHADGPYKGSIWASFGVADPEWYQSQAALNLIKQIAIRMQDPLFLVDGGANFYTYFENQQMTLGATVANLGNQTESIRLRVTCMSDKGEIVVDESVSAGVAPGKSRLVCCEKRFPEKSLEYTVTCELYRGNLVVDRLIHKINVWKPRKDKHFVMVKNGEFILDGKRWRPHGVNYMPSSGIGTEDGPYFEYWIDRRSYDPEVIQRDLEHIKDLGFNSVSIFIYSHSTESQNLLDILRRLEALDLKANLSLRPGTPMNFLWPEIRKIIEYYRLWENDTVFAYDLAWEPMFDSHKDRKIWDRDWEAWIVERYGSIDNAEKDWGFPVPRDESGQVTNPLPHQIDTDGEWRVMVAAYRRFLDTLLYKKYAEARRLVRSVDPNHLVSFRMAEAANPTFRWGDRIPYDFPYLAGAVDFLAPEAYGRMGDWERTKPGWFQREYARWAAPEKPMIWAEAGVNTWDVSRMSNSLERLAFAAEAYRNFYRLLIESGADGVFFWWYPGGFRVGENSDYGIIEPDGTDREVTRVIREYGPKFLEASPLKPVDYWITIDRDRHPDGIAGVYKEVKDEFWNAIEAGKTPGLRTIATNTDSCNTPDLAVGNTKPNGTNPLKFLDGAFDLVEALSSDRHWSEVSDGARVRLGSNGRLVLRVTMTNLGESAWSTQPGCDVTLNVIDDRGKVIHEVQLGKRVARLESLSVPHIELDLTGESEPLEIILRLAARNRGLFGEAFRMVVEP